MIWFTLHLIENISIKTVQRKLVNGGDACASDGDGWVSDRQRSWLQLRNYSNSKYIYFNSKYIYFDSKYIYLNSKYIYS